MKRQVDIFFSQHPGDIVIVFKSKCIEKFYVAGFIVSEYELFFVKINYPHKRLSCFAIFCVRLSGGHHR